MKNKNFLTRYFFLFLALPVLALSFSACDKDDDDTMNDETYELSGNASGNQEVPAVSTSATATLSGTYNASTNTMNYTINWTGLTGVVAAAHFHGPATSGANAGVLFGINISTNGIDGSTSGSMVVADSVETALLNGNVYYNIHTATNPDGEIRGQVVTTQN